MKINQELSYDSINNWYLTLYGHVQQHLGMALIIKLNRTVFISLSKSKNDSLVFNYSGWTVYHDVNQWYHVNDTDQFALTLASINLISSWSQSIYYLIYHNPPLKIVESTTLTSTKQSLRQQITIIFKQTRIPVKNKYTLTIIPV